MINILSIDVEDYWSIFSRDWLQAPQAAVTEAVLKNTRWYLETLAKYRVKATFFVLGEVAQAFPALMREIADAGHELGIHGFMHRQVFKLSPDQFRREVSDCKKLLEDLTSLPVAGHRAPAFSIMPETKWALDILAEEGFAYDSSIFPIAGRRYGWPGFPRDIIKLNLPSGRSIIEVPMSTVQILNRSLPVAGGGYVRHFPYWVSRMAIRKIEKERPAIIYMHPYEIEQPEAEPDFSNLSPSERNKVLKMHRMQLRNRPTMKAKIQRLLADFRFASIQEVIQSRTSLIQEMKVEQ